MKQLVLTIAMLTTICFQSSAQQITGLIHTETDIPIHNVEVNETTTDIDGTYMLSNPTAPLTIQPLKNDDPLNGLTVCDLIDIRRHVLGMENLDSPYKLIAADVNNSGQITTLDIVEISRVMLGVEGNFNLTNSWTFVDENFLFPEPTNPFQTAYPTVVNVNELTEDLEADFIGVKMGDVNNSAIGSYPGSYVSDPEILSFDFEDDQVSQQDEYIVEFKAKDFIEVFGFQFTLSYDPTKMEFLEINEVEISNANSNFLNTNLVEDGMLVVLWVDDFALTIPDDEVVFTAKFKVNETIQLNETLMFTNDFLPIASRNSVGCFGEENSPPFTTSANEIIDALSNIRIFPNPIDGLFDLQLELPTTNEVRIELFDVIGRQLLTKEFSGTFIQDEFDISNFSNGIYFISIHVDGEVITKRIVKS